MGLLLIIAVAVVAAENIELEPVQDLYSQDCGAYNGSKGGTKATCQLTPYCWWNGGNNPGTCHTDPCFKWINDAATTGDCATAGNSGGVPLLTCNVMDFEVYTPDCSTPTTTATKKYCSAQSGDIGVMTYCTYEYLKSNRTSCPAYFCEKGTIANGFDVCLDVTSGGCPNNNKCECLTETYCALNPYCYVANHTCIEDLCTDYFDTDGQGCAARKDVHPEVSGLYGAISDDCVAFTIFDGDTGHANGATKDLCVNSKRNKAPNKCYFLSNGYTVSGSNNCTAYSIPKCVENEECKAETNTTGPYADYYCGDAGHTSSSIMVHAPAIVMIVLAVLAFL